MGPRPAGAQRAAAAHAGAYPCDGHGRHRAPRRSPLPRRPGDRRRLLPHRRPAGRLRRPPEGRRGQRERPAQLRHAPSRGLPQGDPPVPARRAAAAASRHLHRHARRVPRAGVRGARRSRGHRPLDRGHGRPAKRRSSRSSPARAGRAARWRSPSATWCSRSRTRSTRSSARRARRASCGAIAEFAQQAAVAMRLTAAEQLALRRDRRGRARAGRRRARASR